MKARNTVHNLVTDTMSALTAGYLWPEAGWEIWLEFTLGKSVLLL
jgi:hypothetical protein